MRDGLEKDAEGCWVCDVAVMGVEIREKNKLRRLQAKLWSWESKCIGGV